MAEATPKKYLSYAGILAVAANTMNGPAFTTLPDVAADAGLGLYVVLIAISVTMAAFVCRRMVYAMWSSLDSEDDADCSGGGDEEGNYDAVQKTTPLSIAGSDSKVGEEEDATATETDAILVSRGKKDREVQPNLEKTSIVGQSLEAYGPKGGYYAALAMVASALCLALAQMMLCAGVVDEMFVALGGKSCALGMPTASSGSILHCSTHASMKPFMGTGAPTSLVSVGWFVGASASVAMGTVDLDDLISLQYFLFGCLALSAVRFSFVLTGMARALGGGGESGDDADSAGRMLAAEEVVTGGDEGSVGWFVGPDPFQTVGPIMFNFAFIVTSPSSVCLAKDDKTAAKALGAACAAMGAMYAMVGLTGASVSNAVRHGMIEGESDSNLLSLIMMSGGEDGASMLDLCIIALFGFSTVASIPVYCLLAKETLITDAGVAPFPAFLLSNVLPWVIVALTYNAAFFDAFVNWSGLLILGYTNFSMPLLLDLKLKAVRAAGAMGKKVIAFDDASTTKLTRGVMILVTASITSVIVISIADSLTLAGVAFLFTVGLVAHVKV